MPSLFAGMPLYEEKGDKIVLKGIGTNTCAKFSRYLYINVLKQVHWINSTLINDPHQQFEDAFVNGLCPYVKKVAEAENYACNSPGSMPGKASGISKVSKVTPNYYLPKFDFFDIQKLFYGS